MKITKLGMEHCAACDQAERMLKAAGLEFRAVDCESDEGVEWCEKLHIRNVPVVLVEYEDGSQKLLLNIMELKQWITSLR